MEFIYLLSHPRCAIQNVDSALPLRHDAFTKIYLSAVPFRPISKAK